MSTTRQTRMALAFTLGIALVGVIGCSKEESRPATPETNTAATAGSQTNQVQYTCPMHPEVVKGGPNRCDKCGMNLVVKK